MLQLRYLIASFLFSLLLLTPNVSHANDISVDFIGTFVVINNEGTQTVVNVKHLMDKGASTEEIVEYVLRMMR